MKLLFPEDDVSLLNVDAPVIKRSSSYPELSTNMNLNTKRFFESQAKEDSSLQLDVENSNKPTDSKHIDQACSKNKQRGKSYMCNLPKKKSVEQVPHIINHSKLSQHIRESHYHLLQDSTMDALIEKIKIYSDTLLSDNQKIGKEKCPKCDIFVTSCTLASHMVNKHNMEKDFALVCKSKIVTERAKDDFLELNCLSEAQSLCKEYSKFLLTWSGGGYKSTTCAKYQRALMKIFNALEINDKPYEIISIDYGTKLSQFIEASSEHSPANASSMITALKHFKSFLEMQKFSKIDNPNLTLHLTAFSARLEKLTQSFGRKVKKRVEATRRDALDETLLTQMEVQRLHDHATLLISKAKNAKISDPVIPLAIGTFFSFCSGNAHRPDVATNASLQEFEQWKIKSNGIFKVAEHKTAHIYGPAKVCTDGIEGLLLKYGEYRSSVLSGAEKLLHFSDGFSNMWTKERKLHPSIEKATNTAYRKYIETQAKLHLPEDEQRIVSEHLLHKFNVAKQHYQATPARLTKAAVAHICNLLGNIAHPAKIQTLKGITIYVDLVLFLFCFV